MGFVVVVVVVAVWSCVVVGVGDVGGVGVVV